MKFARRVILFVSLTVLTLSFNGTSDLPKLSLVKEEAKNFFTGLAGENNQILVVKIAINIHLEAVNATRNVRSKPLIRLFRLAGKAPLPVRYAFEDDIL